MLKQSELELTSVVAVPAAAPDETGLNLSSTSRERWETPFVATIHNYSAAMNVNDGLDGGVGGFATS